MVFIEKKLSTLFLFQFSRFLYAFQNTDIICMYCTTVFFNAHLLF